MNYEPELLLVAAVATVGVLHTSVPDHWVRITLIARGNGAGRNLKRREPRFRPGSGTSSRLCSSR